MKKIGLGMVLAFGVLGAPVQAQQEGIMGSQTTPIRIDGGEAVAIPKDWRFVGVSNGEKTNSNNLWFEAKDGTIYVIRGFTSGGTFSVHSLFAQTLPRR